MMKKYFILILSSLLLAGFSLPVAAIELIPEAAGKIPPSYAAVKNGKIVYARGATAYSPSTFNNILEAYGLTLTPEAVANVPVSYAKSSGGINVFPSTSTAYEPAEYHSVFTAYGLLLSSEEVGAKLGAINYAKVVNGKIVFARGSTAYGPGELALILSTYHLPIVVEEVVAVVVETDCIDSDGDTVCDEIDVCGGTPRGVKADERGCWTLEQSYFFDFDKAEIKPEAFPLLDHIAKVMGDNPKVTVQIEGHTDSIGSVEYNQGLSERRANAIKNSLVKRNGIAGGRLKAVGFGESNPFMSNDTEAGRAKNRRVDLKPIW